MYIFSCYICLNPDVFSIYIYQKSRSEGSIPNSPHYTPVSPCWAGGVTVYLCSYFAFLQLIEQLSVRCRYQIQDTRHSTLQIMEHNEIFYTPSYNQGPFATVHTWFEKSVINMIGANHFMHILENIQISICPII